MRVTPVTSDLTDLLIMGAHSDKQMSVVLGEDCCGKSNNTIVI